MKKGRKIILGALFLGTAALLVTGCDLKKNETKQENQPVEEKSKGNCKILDCINKIEITDTLETINSTMGFDGEQSGEGNGWKKYKWELNEDENVEVTFFESRKDIIKINFKDEKIKNNKVDFSEFAELKKQISGGTEIKYDKIKESFKAEGTLVEKGDITNVYRWVNGDGGYMNVSFSTVNGKCTFAMGRY